MNNSITCSYEAGIKFLIINQIFFMVYIENELSKNVNRLKFLSSHIYSTLICFIFYEKHTKAYLNQLFKLNMLFGVSLFI